VPKQEEHPFGTEKRFDRGAKEGMSWFLPGSSHRKQFISIAIAALVFTVIVLKINHKLFTTSINEYHDYAANTLQIEDAKHFRTLLGNYSQWGFHHPGPVFFYLLALGEVLFHDWFRLVPAVMNAQLVTVIILNSTFLFAAIGIFAQHSRSRLFVPVAIVSSIYFIYVINQTVPGSALTSVWMPHVLLFPFLLFVTACASVAAGKAEHLSMMTLAGLMLLHGHVAQPLFVCPLAIIALAALWHTRGRQVGLWRFLRVSRRTLWISAALIVLFALPIVLEVMIHRPNNIQHILIHISTHPGAQYGWGRALKYETSFVTFVVDTAVALQRPSAGLISAGGSHPYVAVYWCLCCFLAGLTLATLSHRRTPLAVFIKWLLVQLVVVMLLFFYWSTRISGAQFSFHGYFFYSLQLIFIFVMVFILLGDVAPSLNWLTVTTLSCTASLFMLMAKPYFRNTEAGFEETGQMIASLPADLGMVRFQFPHDDWDSIVGVASHMKREGHPFCVTDNYWSLFFGTENVCGSDMTRLKNLIFTRKPRACEMPCRTLVKGPNFALQLSPYPWLNVPFQIENDGSNSLNENFFWDSGGLWTTKKSTIHFLLTPEFKQDPIKIHIAGYVIPGRPVDISLNRRHLGIIATGQSTVDFVAPGGILMPGKENALTFEVKNAGPVLHDWRELGFYVTQVEFERSNSDCR
jgi:hypothetical protein